MSPQTTEEGGLAFARNMKLDDDGNLVSDYGYKNITCTVSNDANPAVALNTYNIVGHIVGLDDKIYFFTSNNKIIEYDEVLETAIKLNTTWTYSGGEIDGYVSTNQSGEKILTIGEYLNNDTEIPLKHINLKEEINNGVKSWPFANVEESLYCQAPKCPTMNLILDNTYSNTIPNGVYIFFVRFRLREDVYTDWFLCSHPIFSGTSEQIITFQGGLKYVNLHKDSSKSFVFKVDFATISGITPANISAYDKFQLGFIINNDESTNARVWKSFNLNHYYTNSSARIYFDYEDVQEISIDDLLKNTYELYNVRNITSFKNRLYIANYKESSFEPLNKTSWIDVDYKIVDDSGYNSYNALSLKPGSNDYHDLEEYADSCKGFTYWYDNYIYQGSLQQYIRGGGAYCTGLLATFNINVSSLYKTSSNELENAISIRVTGRVDYDPDVIYVSKVINNLYKPNGNTVLFPSADVYYNRNGNGFRDVGLTDSAVYNAELTPALLLYYKMLSGGNGHPWHSSGLTYGFGLFDVEDTAIPDEYKYAEYSDNGVSFINNSIVSTMESYAVAKSHFINESIRDTIKNAIVTQIENKSRLILGYAIISSGTKTYKINTTITRNISVFEDANYGGEVSDYNFGINNVNSVNSILDIPTGSTNKGIYGEIRKILGDNLYAVSNEGIPILYINGEYVKANNITFVFKSCEFKLNNEENNDNDNDQLYDRTFIFNMNTAVYKTVCNFEFKDIIITQQEFNNDSYKQQSTLIPLSTYKIYAHFVDKNNIISNGLFLKSITVNNNSTPAKQNLRKYILKYKIINDDELTELKQKYNSFFLSIENVGDIIVETFGLYTKNDKYYVNVLEADALLYNINDNITLVDYSGTVISETGKYYSSGTSNPTIAFGNCGIVEFTKTHSGSTSSVIYIKIQRNTQNEDNKLIKATKYIGLNDTGVNYIDVPKNESFYGGYFCAVKKPSFELASECYVSGNDIYSANRSTSIVLTEFNDYAILQDSFTYFIRSNFNLNYLSLTEDINEKIYSIEATNNKTKQIVRTINSLTLSSIYELKSMYKSFLIKTFNKDKSTYKTQFDNTIRVSYVLSDETFNNSVFKFAPVDYYNIPTDRGVIVNLFSIGNNIFVHTKSSFYKFDGNQTITSNNNDIQLQESEPFDAGITQIFDSEYGYGGIDTKQSGCITFDSYFFYDKSSNHIFAYSGNAQVQLIDGNIYKLLAYYKPSECKTLHDELNCRVLFEFTSGRSEHSTATYKTFTLSYNYKTKTFVSFHDLSLVNAFSSRHKAYSYKSFLLNLFDTEQTYTHLEVVENRTITVTTQINVTSLVAEMNINKIFGNATTACIIEFGSQIYKKQIAPFGIAIVMFPRENLRETVNSIKYIADIQQKDPETQSSPIFDVLVNPQVSRTNPVVNFYIVTDCCVSSVVNTNVNDNARPNTLLDYKGFKFDMGAWTSNYFKNDINKTDIYQYGQKYPNRDLDADQNSLVYGRYFIITFDFKADTPVKFEELFMNTQKY